MGRDHKLTEIVNKLHERFGRPPTSREVHQFIFGDAETKLKVWNFGIPEDKKEDLDGS
jgi:hypothetical protein